MNHFETYVRLMLQRLDLQRNNGTDEQDEAITDQMDRPYWAMTEEDRELACRVSGTLPYE